MHVRQGCSGGKLALQFVGDQGAVLSQSAELDVVSPTRAQLLALQPSVSGNPYSTGGGFSIHNIFAAVYRHRFLFATVFGAICTLGALYILGSHKKYTSRMELLVQNSRSAPVVTSGRNESAVGVSDVTDEELNSESELLQSTDVLNEVADPGWNTVPSTAHSKEDQQKHETKVGSIRKGLVIAPIRKSHLLSVQMTSRDPYESVRLLQSVNRAFLKKKLEISHPGGTSEIFSQQADDYRQRWQAAQEALGSYQQEHHIVSIGDEEASLQKQLSDASAKLGDVDSDISEAQQKIRNDQEQLKTIPSRRPTHETAIPASGSIEQLKGRLNELLLARTELTTKYKVGDRLLVQNEQQISQVEAAINQSSGSVYNETSSDINPTWQMVEQDLSSTKTKMQGATGRRVALSDQIAKLESALGLTEAETRTLNSLQHAVSELESSYQLYVQKRDEARMSDVLDEHQLLNVAVAEAPTFSLSPSRPQPLTDSLLTFITALFMASFAVFIAENNRSTLATQAEVFSISRFPILATVPVGSRSLMAAQDGL